MSQVNAESEMEEGEIVDDLDDLSDISSEEEFLLRQRLEVLEDYNNALGRTKKKRSSEQKPMRNLLYDLSEISAAEIDDSKVNSSYHHVEKLTKNLKQYSKPRRKREPLHKNVAAYIKRKKDHRKKSNYSKKKQTTKYCYINESSDESEDEYRNKRRKLADAVVGHRNKTDTSSLSARLKKMLHKSENMPIENDMLNMYCNNNNQRSIKLQLSPTILDSIDEVDCGELNKVAPKEIKIKEKSILHEAIELVTTEDDDVEVVSNDKEPTILENVTNEKPIVPEPKHEDRSDSDEDLAQLRQQVLSTKALKAKPQEPVNKQASEDEDSDTAELRLICLKSTLLKRAIEMKQKQKMQKRLSQSTLEDDIFNDPIFFPSKTDSGNNTDIESMDMDMGSDTDEKIKDGKDERLKKTETDDRLNENNHIGAITSINKEEELEEDEDLLRAKLLISLSKNLPNLVSPELLNNIHDKKTSDSNAVEPKSVKVPEEKRFIIKLGESDSESEHEATENLTKMHMKLSEQTDFQQKLDLFLKSTRMQVENTRLPDVVQKQATPKKPEKFVAKTVKHLPKSEQIEYKNLVRRMAELEKMKQLRQTSINAAPQPLKETLEPRNATIDTNFEEKISISRKKIADESAKMLKLKEEATKLSQKFKIVSNELQNISTAITLNKRQQRSVQNCLTKIRQQHQSLIKSSSTSLHSKVNSNLINFTNKVATNTKLQKENNPQDEYKNVTTQKTVKISVVNDSNKNATNIDNARISVEVNVASNRKIVKMPSPEKEKRVVEIIERTEIGTTENISESLNPTAKECDTIPVEESVNNTEETNAQDSHRYTANDYKSPLDAFGDTSWMTDPNAILCPFEVDGRCKDSDCKYLHTPLSKH